MNLNRRGYLAVEIILASVVAISIAIFLMEITIKLVNVTDDAYIDTEILTDKALITKNIKKLLEDDIEKNGGISSITCTNGTLCQINFCSNSSSIELDNNNQITYNGTNNYDKTLNKNLSNIEITTNKTGNIDNGEYVLFKINANSKFSKENFEANIIVYNNKTC